MKWSACFNKNLKSQVLIKLFTGEHDEDVEWLDEEDVDTTGLQIPPKQKINGFPVVNETDLGPWE